MLLTAVKKYVFTKLAKTYFPASETELISGGSDKQLILWEWNGTGAWNDQVSSSILFVKLPLL